MLDDDWKKPWPEFPNRSGGAPGKNLEREMFWVVGDNAWSPRTVIRDTPDGRVMMKTGGGMTKFITTPIKKSVAIVAALWPLAERDYEERTHFAIRNTLVGTSIACIPYEPLEYAVFLDINGEVVEMIFEEPPV